MVMCCASPTSRSFRMARGATTRSGGVSTSGISINCEAAASTTSECPVRQRTAWPRCWHTLRPELSIQTLYEGTEPMESVFEASLALEAHLVRDLLERAG